MTVCLYAPAGTLFSLIDANLHSYFRVRIAFALSKVRLQMRTVRDLLAFCDSNIVRI